MITHPNSLENLKLGSLSRKGSGSGKIRKNILISQTCAETLNKSGNASRFIEFLVQAHQQKRLLDPSELLDDIL